MSRKHNPAMKARAFRMHPFERQNMRRVWASKTVDAQILALLGDNAANTVDAVGRLFFIVLGASQYERLADDSPDQRILRGAVNALAEIEGAITDLQRASLSSGMEAVKRIVAGIPEETMFLCTVHAEQRLQHGAVTYGDFLELARPRRAA